MKKLILLSLIVLLYSCAPKKSYATFRKENKEDIAFSMGLSSFLVNSFVRDEDFKKVIKHVSGIRKYHVLVSKQDSKTLKRNLTNFLDRNNYEEIFHVANNNEKVHIYSFQNGDKLKEIIFKIEGDNEMVVLSVEGDLKINDFQKLTAFND